MFTGIVEELGTLIGLEHLEGDAARVRIAGPVVCEDAVIGCSISVNGVCLTAVDLGQGQFAADVMAETLRLTTIGQKSVGDAVNLERALRANGRWGGHIVSGHVDGVGTVLSRSPAPHWDLIRISLPRECARLVATKGSVALDGVSLTVTGVGDEADGSHWLEVSLIPETLTSTTLGAMQVGDRVNIEADILAKYLERLVEWKPDDSSR